MSNAQSYMYAQIMSNVDEHVNTVCGRGLLYQTMKLLILTKGLLLGRQQLLA